MSSKKPEDLERGDVFTYKYGFNEDPHIVQNNDQEEEQVVFRNVGHLPTATKTRSYEHLNEHKQYAYLGTYSLLTRLLTFGTRCWRYEK